MADFKGAKGRDDTFFGTDGADTFRFDPSDLTSGDLIYGGDGDALDTLVFTGRGVIESTALSAVIGIERIELSDAGNTITLVQSLLETAANGSLTVQGGAGADRINAAGIYDEPDVDGGTFLLLGGAGDDVLIGGKDDRLILDGQAGSDTILINRGTAVYDPLDQRITAMSDRAVLAIGTGLTLDLTRTRDQTDGDRAIVTGFWNADASRSTQAVTLIGRNGSTLTGGSGADTITGGTILRGGAGRDTIVGSATEGYHLFQVGEGEFARGESITGLSANDQLSVSGSADFRQGTLVGMNTISVGPGSSAKTTISFFTSQVVGVQFYGGFQEGKTVVVNLYVDTPGTYTNSFFFGVPVAVYGTSRADVLAVDGATVYGGLGNDTLLARPGSGLGGLLDGGQGVDTLIVTSGGGYTIDLSSATRQGLLYNTAVRGFENVDLSGIGACTVVGSKVANHVVGSFGADTIDGRLGNDVIEGANGADVLTGGGGRDTFVWSAADGQPDTITDFDPREDRLAFARDVFGVPGGVFDTRVVAGSDTDLTGADLVISRRALDSVADVIAFVNAAPGGSNEGLFIVAQTSAGHTLLYYSASGTAADMNSVHALADLGAVSPNQIALSDFAYL